MRFYNVGMTWEWSITLFANLVLAALLIVCRPARSGWVWAYIGASLVADWFCLSNASHLQDELFNVPWEFMDLACIFLESMAVAQMLMHAKPCLECYAAVMTTSTHLMMRFYEYLAWETYTGRFRFRTELNREGWHAYYIRQDWKIVSAIALCAFMLKMRSQREKESYEP